jgi:NAD(P)-dependent dehydrogenase (short-subunit alcohol dehydrogenase family)
MNNTAYQGTEKPLVLVTGSAKRIGREIALSLSRSGFSLALHYHQSEQEAKEVQALAQRQQVDAEIFQADLSNQTEVAQMVQAIKQKYAANWVGLINNASQFLYDHPNSFNTNLLENLTRTNVTTPCWLAEALYHHCLTNQTQGFVINLLDQKLENLNPDFFSYTLTKAALASATKMQAQAFGPTLRICGVSPGMSSPTIYMDKTTYQKAQTMSLLKRNNTMSDVAQAVCFLAQSQNITGSILHVDAGQHLCASDRDILFAAGGNVTKD